MRISKFIPALLGFATAAQPVSARDMLVLVGTQGNDPGQGIVAVRLNAKTGALTPVGLAAELKRPIWLERDPRRPIVWSVSDAGNADGPSTGRVYAFSIDRRKGTLSPLNDVASGGRGPTYLAFDRQLATLFVANFGSGQVAAIPVDTVGRLGAATSVQQHSGNGPHRRQASPHAHAVVIDPSRRYVLSPDLGADRLFVYRYNPATRTLTSGPMPFVQLAPGSGPRHLRFGRDGRHAYLLNELSAEIVVFRWNARTGELVEQARMALADPPAGVTKSASEIALSRDGNTLYVGNRSTESVEVYAVDHRAGDIRRVQTVASGSKGPWHFAVAPGGRWMLVSNQGSDTLNVLRVDHGTGRLSATGISMPVAKPVSVVFD